MLYYEPPPSKHRHYLDLFLLVLHDIVNGEKKLHFKDHFNQVVREAKIVCEDPKNAAGFASQSYYLAGCMLDFEDLRQEIMQINTVDDIDEEISNRILLRLEPAYARPERDLANF